MAELCAMYPQRLIAILEAADPSFRDLFYPKALRCPLGKRIVRAIEERWPVYFPTRKECRGSSWSLTIPEGEPLYKPYTKSGQKLAQWKKDVKGTIVEIRIHGADISWRRFVVSCRKIPKLKPLLRDFKPLADFLINEESIWPNHGNAPIGAAELFKAQMRALFSAGSPYRHADPKRLGFLHSKQPLIEKIRMIDAIHQLFDRPLIALAVLQQCASRSKHSQFWLPIEAHITAIIKIPAPITFRKTWLEHAMQVSGAIKPTGKSCPRKWAKLLSSGTDLDVINAKAIEVNSWLKGKKQPSLKNITHAGRVVFTPLSESSTAQTEADLWLFSWMITVWLEKHFAEIAVEFKNDRRQIQRYYQRFFHHLEIDWSTWISQTAGRS